MSSWEEKFKTMQEKSTFCGDLTTNIEHNDFREEEFSECILNPLKYVERKYKNELYAFGRMKKPDINNLLDCTYTKKILNVIAKEDPEKSYQINYCNGIPKALDDLNKYIGKEIESISEIEKNKRFREIETCLPIESYVIEQEKKKREGIGTVQKLKCLLTPEQKEQFIIPHTIAVTQEFEHFSDSNKNEDQHIKDIEEERFEKMTKEKRLIKGKRI